MRTYSKHQSFKGSPAKTETVVSFTPIGERNTPRRS